TGNRLAGYRLRLLDARRQPLFVRQFIRAPKPSQEINLVEFAEVPLKAAAGVTAGKRVYTLVGPIAGRLKVEFRIALKAGKSAPASHALRLQLVGLHDALRRERE